MYTPRLTYAWCLHLLQSIDNAIANGLLGFPVSDIPPEEDCDVRALALGRVLDAVGLGPTSVGKAHKNTLPQDGSRCSIPGIADVFVTPRGAMTVLEPRASAHTALYQRARLAEGIATLAQQGQAA